MNKPLVSYLRVSTREQGRSGLGIAAQRAAVARFATVEGYALVGEFVEIETGKGSDALDRRPQLAAALAEARRHGKCAVAVSKLDRLSRDVHFISGLPSASARSSASAPGPLWPPPRLADRRSATLASPRFARSATPI
jgi:hypothetical protein